VWELSSSWAWCHGPTVSTSWTISHPDGVIQVVSTIIVPGTYRTDSGTSRPYGPTLNEPARRLSSAPNTLAESNRGTHSHSMLPSGAISAPV